MPYVCIENTSKTRSIVGRTASRPEASLEMAANSLLFLVHTSKRVENPSTYLLQMLCHQTLKRMIATLRGYRKALQCPIGDAS